MTLPQLKAELFTHGITCECAHKKMCEDREEWLRAEIAKQSSEMWTKASSHSSIVESGEAPTVELSAYKLPPPLVRCLLYQHRGSPAWEAITTRTCPTCGCLCVFVWHPYRADPDSPRCVYPINSLDFCDYPKGETRIHPPESVLSADQWQPIETAPKDGEELLLWIPADNDMEIAFWRDDANAWDTWEGWLQAKPSHWMRPAPPEQPNKETK